MMKVNKNIKQWYNNGGKKKIEEHMEDKNGIFTTSIGYEAGVYGVYILTPPKQEIPMYIGEVGKEGRGFRDRLVEHAKYWIENPEWYTGLKMSELKSGYKYLIRILALEADHNKRYALEQSLIEEIKPYLQFNCYPKYNSSYRGNDLALFPTYRRRAFIVSRDGKYTEQDDDLFVDNIFKIAAEVDLNDYRTATPDQSLMELITKEMPNGSELCKSVKQFVEHRMGIVSTRGCRYSYLVKLVSAALETKYKEEYSL